MSRKTVYAAVGAVLVILGIYFLSNQKNGNFIDLEEGQKHVCRIDDSQQLLLAYTGGSDTYIAVLQPQSDEVQGTCELPFENNEHIYISQNPEGILYVYNDTGEVFRFNGSHFVKIPSNLYSGNADLQINESGRNTQLSLRSGSVCIEKKISHASQYDIKNAYVYSHLQDMNTLNLYDLKDPMKEVKGSYIVVRIKAYEQIYYAIYDYETRELLRCIVDPFESGEGAFAAVNENGEKILFAGEQAFHLNYNMMVKHSAMAVDEAIVTPDYVPYSEGNNSEAVKVKASNGETYTYVIQSRFAVEYVYVVI